MLLGWVKNLKIIVTGVDWIFKNALKIQVQQRYEFWITNLLPVGRRCSWYPREGCTSSTQSHVRTQRHVYKDEPD